MNRCRGKRTIGVSLTGRLPDNTKPPHSALGYRPPAPEAIIPMDQRPTMHSLSIKSIQAGLLNSTVAGRRSRFVYDPSRLLRAYRPGDVFQLASKVWRPAADGMRRLKALEDKNTR